MRRPLRVIAGALALFHALISLAPAQTATHPAADYPSRTITWIVPYPPGGPPDVVVRLFAVPMAKTLGQPIVIENRPGASTAIATTIVARSDPDGHTLLAAGVTQSIAPLVLKSPGFDPFKDLKPVGIMARAKQILAVSPSLPVKTMQELVALARSNPDAIKIAHSGVGVPTHLTPLAFMEATNTRMPLVFYRGIAQAVSDVVAGHVQLVVTGASITSQLHDEGRLRILGVTGEQRTPSLPKVPTFDESGVHLKAMRKGNWFGTAAPGGTPDAVIAKFNAAAALAARDPSIVTQLAKLDMTVSDEGPAEMARLMRDEFDYWSRTFKTFGVNPTE